MSLKLSLMMSIAFPHFSKNFTKIFDYTWIGLDTILESLNDQTGHNEPILI